MAFRPPERRISAILGPTNTGKTHRAIERMLGHRSGMIGLPLRLLAREVYDRVVERRGVEAVALVTGEEKRIPADPQFFVCTVEAMPVDRKVAFVAVDEIQLAGDRNRGHTFTDRLLHARGTEETVFLGAATIAPVLETLIPGVEIESAPRLSKLTWAGTRKLASVPPRSAVTAFSAEAVYETAERLRAVHGGAAVVLGALSPRTRNAQVAMYQAGEVKHLVATDAIGMGLNMDIQHVAFAGVRKFDGRGHRELSSAELAQIAGRAGRYRNDGTFGTTREVGDLRPDLIESIESHDFPPLTHLFWRNSDLDLGSPEALLQTLRAPPPSRVLLPASTEEDERTLEILAGRPEIRRLLGSVDAVARLWEVCQVPDYRKTHTDAHVELLGQIALHLLGEGALPDAFVDQHVARLHRTDGDIETLMSRIAWIRTWTYVAWRGWTRSEAGLRQRTRVIEDDLSDALHERLTARFVDRRVLVVLGPAAADAAVTITGGEVEVGGIAVGRLRDGSFEPGEAPPSRAVQAAVRRRLRSELLPLVREIAAAPHEAIALQPDGRLVWDRDRISAGGAAPAASPVSPASHEAESEGEAEADEDEEVGAARTSSGPRAEDAASGSASATEDGSPSASRWEGVGWAASRRQGGASSSGSRSDPTSAATASRPADAPSSAGPVEEPPSTAPGPAAPGSSASGPAELSLGRLTAGPTALEPKVVVGRLDLLDAADREKIRARMVRWRDDLVAGLFAPLDRPAAAKLGPAGKGLLHALRSTLGTVDRDEVDAIVLALRPDDRALLAKLDVRIGTFTVYVQSLLRQQPMRTRAALWSLAHGRLPLLDPPSDGRPTFRPTGAGRDAVKALGYRVVGGLAIRVDVLEKVGAEIRAMARADQPRSIDVLTSWLGCTAEEALAVVRALGFQVRAQPEGRVRLRRAR